jgi:parvulin-like peptidyl-prolyl isomerase
MSQRCFGPRLAVVLAAAAMMAAQSISFAVRANAQDDLDRVVASVDGDPITVQDLKTFAAVNHMKLTDPGDTRAPATRAVLKEVISADLLRNEVKKYKDKIEERQIDDYIANFEQSNGMSDQQLRAQLQAQGHTYQQFRDNARLELQKMMMIQKEVRGKVNVSPEEVKAYYDAHRQEFTSGKETFKVAQILVAVPPNATPAEIDAARTKAESIRKQLLSGADFGQLARQYSDDDSKNQGGDLGNFSRGDMLDPIQNAIDGMKPGDISEPVQTDHGFHILKLEAHDQGQVKPLSEVSDQIRDKLTTEKAQQEFSAWVDNDLVKQHYVEMFN